MKKIIVNTLIALVVLSSFAVGQQNSAPVNPASVILWAADGCNTDNASATFSFYANKTDVSPLWQETQANADQNDYNFVGNASGGLPADIFSNGNAKWLELSCNGGANGSTRIFLTAVPYAISSVDSSNLGGRPASDYALVSQLNANSSSTSVSTETSRAQQSEADLSQQITNEANTRQNAVSALQLNDVTTASQIASMNAAIVALQAQVAALQATNAALSAKVTTLTSSSSAQASRVTTTTSVVVIPVPVATQDVTPVTNTDTAIETTARASRSARLSGDIQ